jgi:hypothetical protein
MPHTLELTNATRLLTHNLLHIPESFKTPSEILRAAKLVEKLACPVLKSEEVTEEWLAGGAESLEITEAQRDLLKQVAGQHAAKLPPSAAVVSLLTQLGFES